MRTMEPNQHQPMSTQSNDKKWVILVIIILIIGGGIFAYSKYMSDTNTSDVKSEAPDNLKIGYLEKGDPIYQLLAARVITDVHTAVKEVDSESPENIALQKKIKSLSKERQDEILSQMNEVVKNSMGQYLLKTKLADLLDNGEDTVFGGHIIMSSFQDFGKEDPSIIKNRYDMRIQSLGSNQYVVEFWLDWSYEPGRMADLAAEGKIERYSKDQAFLYTVTPDKEVVFHNPFQEVNDFVKTL